MNRTWAREALQMSGCRTFEKNHVSLPRRIYNNFLTCAIGQDEIRRDIVAAGYKEVNRLGCSEIKALN